MVSKNSTSDIELLRTAINTDFQEQDVFVLYQVPVENNLARPRQVKSFVLEINDILVMLQQNTNPVPQPIPDPPPPSIPPSPPPVVVLPKVKIAKTVDGLSVRSKPDISSKTVYVMNFQDVAELLPDQPVVAGSITWVKVRLHGNSLLEGWASKKYLVSVQ